MIRRAKLYARLKDDQRVAIQFDRNGRAREPQDVSTYLLRIAAQFINVGRDFATAITRLHQEQARLADGVPRKEATDLSTPTVHKPAVPGRIRIADAAEEFISELRALDRKKHSVSVYENTLRNFQESCRKEFIDEITRKDILGFLGWMRANLQVRVPGSENATYKNKLGHLRTFLGRHGGVQLLKKDHNDSGLLFRSDVPKTMKRKPKKYEQSTITTLLDKADVDERDYLEFLLWSGFRDEEVQYLLFSDLNFRTNTAMVQAKPQFNWKPKDYEEREITLPTPVMKRLKDRMGRMQAEPKDLVFPNGDCRPDSHLIYRLHAVAKKAGLNLKGKRAGHMFRKTAGSRVARAEGLPAAMEFLGHSNIATTALYLAADTATSTKRRQAVDALYHQGQD